MTRDKTDELGETFLELTALPPWIPDEMTNAQRCEIFAFIPGSQPGNSSIAFVLPDFFRNPQGVTMRETDRGNRLQLKEHACDEEKCEEKMSSALFRLLLFS
jgi:hypothetical protein